MYDFFVDDGCYKATFCKNAGGSRKNSKYGYHTIVRII
ncbi:hypothetical protein EVA_20712 [gut metagenome]|uniref:Uncharacterized protein n=1 Tax=gut metagenome TaxID=749906 RepID=J9FNL3_9ZZZZ